MFSNLNIKNKIMSKKMIIGAFIFIGYICGINYILRNSLFISDNDTDSSSEIETEQPNNVDKQDIQMEEIECEKECEEKECEEKECEKECKEKECEIECEEKECEEKECESDTNSDTDNDIRYKKIKGNLRTLFEKKKYMVELDRELADIKDRLEDIRNNLHNFN
jgi:hypothetical protein